MNVNYSVGSVGAPMGGYKDSSYYSYLQKIQQNNTEQQTKSAHNKRSQGVEITSYTDK